MPQSNAVPSAYLALSQGNVIEVKRSPSLQPSPKGRLGESKNRRGKLGKILNLITLSPREGTVCAAPVMPLN